MADYKSDWYTLYEEVVPRQFVPGLYNAPLIVRRMPTYTVPTGGIAANKTIALMPYRKGEVPLIVELSIESGGVASGGVMQLGDGSTAALYGEGSANALNVSFCTTHALGRLVEFAANGVFTLTTKTGTAGLVAAKKVFFVAYLIPATSAN